MKAKQCVAVVMMTWTLCAAAWAGGPNVKLGIDVLREDGFKLLDGKRVGLITNPTGVSGDLKSTVDLLHNAANVKLVALYGPEHGVRGDAYAGDKVESGTDPATKLPVYSLYGATRQPTAEMLDGLDTLVFDIQDIGSRSYTFISTMTVAMQAAAEHKLQFVVLDRPNPLGGDRIEGKPLDMEFRSFIGFLPIPYLHGMTVGELAQMINDEGWLEGGVKCDLTVVKMEGWKRSMCFDDCGLVWVPSSPHVPRAESAMFYAATGIMGELHVVSEGVGYPLPFELVGLPDADAERFASELDKRNLPGVRFRPIYFKPYYGPNKGKVCGGAQVHLIDPDKVHLTSIQFHVMDVVRSSFPDSKLFDSKRKKSFDKACGTDEIRNLFEAGKPIADILAKWNEGVDDFRNARAKYLLYQ
ncbi:MAG: DUF1343 domain-containing protein [Phycisphaerales bacterium]|nr:DUF1343 domain-containing protein [Phycisphaerales bacterium]